MTNQEARNYTQRLMEAGIRDWNFFDDMSEDELVEWVKNNSNIERRIDAN